ncbi:hypothetical protein IMZ48_47765 [Candidatus Bathyarchaeota archaeon]|nr:hypothetical protein [Candidatus Bathyarchaeota archaeon]
MHAVIQEMAATDARIATLVKVMAKSLLGPRISCRHRSPSVPPNQIHEIMMSEAVRRVSEPAKRTTTHVPTWSTNRTREGLSEELIEGLDERGSFLDGRDSLSESC